MENNTEFQYNGFLKTPNLWLNSEVFGLKQFHFLSSQFPFDEPSIFKEIRLGKRVEEFLSFQFSNLQNITIITENLQIKKNKVTIGELDFLLKNKEEKIHLEVVYKFYLYDPNIKSDNNLDFWIGPNRKDTLVYKLTKIKEKQLPLLHSKSCKLVLEDFELNNMTVNQHVCYKSQLFLPYKNQNIDVKPLNKDCVFGFYISYSKIEELQSYQFYMPRKLDWLVIPHSEVDWKSYDEIRVLLSTSINQKRSPMVWLKSSDNKLSKCFISFW